MEWMRRSAPVIFLIIAVTFVGGFLLVESSGLLGRGALTPTTAVATVNGEDILATRWYALTQQLEQQETQGTGRSLSLDERERLADRAFEELVGEALLSQEYDRRGITVTDEEVRSAAQYSPPPDMMRAPELQTEGRFDPVKYQRFLASPAVRQQGLLLQLEAYYRAEIPRQKLVEQIASGVYVSDQELWERWRARNDSARVSFVRFDPEAIPDASVSVTDAEIRQYYERHKKDFEQPTKAVVSVMVIPRTTTAADTVAARARAASLRQEIVARIRPFEEIARTESSDSVSAQQGGDLGRGPRGRFVDAFEEAAFALRPGELSQPVLTQFGYHIIRVDERKADTIAVRHVLVPIQQSDSAAARTDRRADSLSRIASAADDPRKFDEASRLLGLPISRGTVIEGNPFTIAGRYVPSVSAWATGGARKGEVSELFDWDEGYAIARVDSVTEGGTPRLDAVSDNIRTLLLRLKKLDLLATQLQSFAATAATSSLEAAARARAAQLQQSEWVTRAEPTALGRANEATGAAFTLPIGRVSTPIRTLDGVFVLRVDDRREAARADFERQKADLRRQELTTVRQERLRLFLQNLRETADISDRRREITAAQRELAQ